MAEHSIDRPKGRHDLKIARTKLLEQFLKHPKEARPGLAVEIIDDQIVNCTEWIRRRKRARKKSFKSFCINDVLPKSR
jgi:hypothetical protein